MEDYKKELENLEDAIAHVRKYEDIRILTMSRDEREKYERESLEIEKAIKNSRNRENVYTRNLDNYR